MHKFDPANALRLERPDRHELLRPADTLRKFGLAEGMTLVDVGAGTGFFARAAAGVVGPSGRVYAVDSSEEMLGLMRQLGLPPQVIPLWSQEYAIPLPDGTADMALAAFVLHETADRKRFVEELLRIVRRGGRVVVLEWKRQSEEHGPPEEERLAEGELDDTLRLFSPASGGSLNPSHYYRILERK